MPPNYPEHPKLWVLSWITRHGGDRLARWVTQNREPRFLGSSREHSLNFPQNPRFDPNWPQNVTQTLSTFIMHQNDIKMNWNTSSYHHFIMNPRSSSFFTKKLIFSQIDPNFTNNTHKSNPNNIQHIQSYTKWFETCLNINLTKFIVYT